MKYFKLALLVCFCFPVMSQEKQNWQSDIRALAAAGQQLEKEYLEKHGEAILNDITVSEEDLKQFETIGQQLLTKTIESAVNTTGEIDLDSRITPVEINDVLRVFVSFSMPEELWKEVFRAASQFDGEVVLQARGVFKDEGTLDGTVKEAHRLWKLADVPNMVEFRFAPDLFRDFNVQAVPEMIYETAKGQIFTGKGLVDFSYFKEQALASNGEQTSPEIYGRQYEIEEMDLFEDLKARVEKLDLEALGQKRLRDYFKNREFRSLPYAQKHREFIKDPSFVVSEDMYLPNGKRFRKKGEVIRPMKLLPVRQTIIVADLTHQGQVALVKQWVVENQENVITLMTSQFNSEKGWQWLKDIEDHIGVPVYQIDPSILHMADIQHVPALAVSGDNGFTVKEFGPENWVMKKGE